MKIRYRIVDVLYALILAVIINGFFIIWRSPWWILPFAVLFIFTNSTIGVFRRDVKSDRLLLAYHGCVTLTIVVSIFPLTMMNYTYLLYQYLPDDYMMLIYSLIYTVVLYSIIVANGTISIYVASGQLGIKWRALGIMFSMIPGLNIFILTSMVLRVYREVNFEVMRTERNNKRRDDKICSTKYPIVLVHGIFWRDWSLFNYWGRIPEELEANGARIYYGEHQSALPVAESAVELAARIKRIVAKTGCEKVNIIAHSKGGLDCRYAIKNCGIGDMVASLTTINSPHRGCVFAERLLKLAPKWLANIVADSYNKSMRFLGDKTPDFMAGVRDLTAMASERRNRELPAPEGIFCQSVMSKQNGALAGRFPMNLTERYVRKYDGPNDGLVGVDSASFGEQITYVEIKGRRGITHMDMIDLTRENIRGFDVREFYVELVNDLKNRGY